MRILVTGGLGFIGSHLCARLVGEGHQVIAFDNTIDAAAVAESTLLTRTGGGRYRYVPGSIRDAVNFRAALINHTPELVIHLAAIPGVRSSVLHPLLCAETNVQGTTIVLEACKAQGVSKVIFASSSSVYGNPERPGAPSCEEDEVQPLSPYGVTKVAGELLCQTYAHLHAMMITSLRFFSVYGPRQRPDLVLPIFAKQMLAGEPVQVFGDGNALRDYTYIDDIVEGICRTLRRMATPPPADAPGRYECYNLGSGAPVRLKELIHTLQVALDLPHAAVTYLPSHRADVDRTWADIAKAHTFLGYTPQVTFPEGVQRYVEWLR